MISCLLACACAVQSGCQPASDEAVVEQPARALPVETVALKKDTAVRDSFEYFGVLAPHRRASLAFSRSGTIGSASVEIGQTVTQGSVLAELEQADLLRQEAQLKKTIQDPTAASRRNQAQGRLVQVQAELKQGTLTAPFDGTIVENRTNVGSAVPAGQELIRIYDTSTPNVEFDLPVRIASQLDTDREWKLTIDNREVLGKVRHRTPVEQSSGNVRLVFACLTNMRPEWRFGQTVNISLGRPTTKSGFWVPASALIQGDAGAWSVMRIVDKGEAATLAEARFTTERVHVQIDQTRSDRVLINGPLADGQRIVSAGLHRVVGGQRVFPQARVVVGGQREPADSDADPDDGQAPERSE